MRSRSCREDKLWVTGRTACLDIIEKCQRPCLLQFIGVLSNFGPNQGATGEM